MSIARTRILEHSKSHRHKSLLAYHYLSIGSTPTASDPNREPDPDPHLDQDHPTASDINRDPDPDPYLDQNNTGAQALGISDDNSVGCFSLSEDAYVLDTISTITSLDEHHFDPVTNVPDKDRVSSSPPQRFTSDVPSRELYILFQRVLEATFGSNTPNFVYFFHQHLRNKSGLKAIIAHSLLDNYTLCTDIDDHSINLHFDILNLASSLSTRQRTGLSNVFCSMIATYQRLICNNNVQHSNTLHVPVPISCQEIRTKYMRGSKSLWHCLPCPEVSSGYSTPTSKRIVYASVRVNDCVAHFLANGGIVMPKEELCPAALSKLEAMSLLPDESVVFIKLWSDGFEPNNAKQNRSQGLWTVTLTIVGSGTQEVVSDDFQYTFPIAICFSKSSSTQDTLFGSIIDEINKLFTSSTCYYYAHTNDLIKVRLSILVITMDQPERRKRNYVLLGNSKPSNRWGYIVTDYLETSKLLPCCEQCFEALKYDTWSYIVDCIATPCKSCYRWDCSLNPKTQKLSHKYLKQSLNDLNAAMENESMSLTQLKKMANDKGLNEAAATQIYDHHHNVRTKALLSIGARADTEINDVRIRLLDKMSGEKFEVWRGAPLWNSLSHDIEDVVDSPMHLLFLGIVKSTITYISEFVKLRKISQSFESVMKHKLRCVIEQYKVHWMVLIDFKECGDTLDTTGWLAENYIAFSRIFLWFVSSLRNLCEDRIFPPIQPIINDSIQLWSKQQLLEFTEENNVTIFRNDKALTKRKQANVTELRCSIREFKKKRVSEIHDNDTSPTTSDRSTNTCTIEDIITLVRYLHYFIYSVMGKNLSLTKERIRNNIERYSRLYLSQLNKVASNMGIQNVHTRLWNLQSLLNIGTMFERYGHIPLYWEGGIAGEAVIKKMKRERSSLVLKDSLKHMFESLYRRRSLDYLSHEFRFNDSTFTQKSVHVYDSCHEVNSTISRHHPISVLWDERSTTHYVCIKQAGETCFVRLQTKFLCTDDIGSWISIRNIDINDAKHGKDDVYDIHSGKRNNSNGCPYIPQMLFPSVHIATNYYTIISSLWS